MAINPFKIPLGYEVIPNVAAMAGYTDIKKLDKDSPVLIGRKKPTPISKAIPENLGATSTSLSTPSQAVRSLAQPAAKPSPQQFQMPVGYEKIPHPSAQKDYSDIRPDPTNTFLYGKRKAANPFLQPLQPLPAQAAKPTAPAMASPTRKSATTPATVKEGSNLPLEILRGITVNTAKPALSALAIKNPDLHTIQPVDPKRKFTSLTPGEMLQRTVFGDNELKSLGYWVAEQEEKGWPTSLAVVAAAVGSFIDFTGAGGRTQLMKSLTKADNVLDVAKYMRKVGLTEDAIKSYAPIFSETKTLTQTEKAWESMAKVVKPLAKARAKPSDAVKAVAKIRPGEIMEEGRIIQKPSQIVSGISKQADDLTSQISKAKAEKAVKPSQAVAETIGTKAAAIKPSQAVAEVTDVIKKTPEESLLTILEKHKGLRQKTEALYHKARGKQAGMLKDVYGKGEGMAGFAKAKGMLSGELPKAKASPEMVKDFQAMFKSGQTDELFKKVQNNPYLNVWEKTTGQEALTKIFDGAGRPLQKSEIELLESIFGPRLSRALVEAPAFKLGGMDLINEIGGTMKVIMSSMGDMSALFRQNIAYVWRHPHKIGTQIKVGLKSMFDQKYFDTLQEAIVANKYYALGKRTGLSLTDTSKAAGMNISKHEEQFLSAYLTRIPGIGRIVHATERAFVGMLNKARMDWYSDMADNLIKLGYDPTDKVGRKAFQDAAMWTNTATGRGDIGKTLTDNTTLSNFLAWSARLIKSRMDLVGITDVLNALTGGLRHADKGKIKPFYRGMATPVKKEAAKTILSGIAMTGTVLGFASACGADVEWDPRSTDFLKIKIGNNRKDITGGLGAYIRIIAQTALGERKEQSGSTVEINRWKNLARFGRYKTSPVASDLISLGEGKTAMGEDLNWETWLKEKRPLVWQDIDELAVEIGWLKALLYAGPTAFLGIGEQTYGERRGGPSSGMMEINGKFYPNPQQSTEKKKAPKGMIEINGKFYPK